MELSTVPAYTHGHLMKFLEKNVVPPDFQEEIEELNRVVADVIQHVLKVDKSSKRVLENIIQAGSTGKGTAVQKKMDTQLTVFFKNYKTMDAFWLAIPTNLDYLIKCVRTHPNIQVEKPYEFMVKFWIVIEGRMHSLYIYPAMDLIAQKTTWAHWLWRTSKSAVYDDMSKNKGDSWTTPLCYYTPCFTELQINYIKKCTKENPQLLDLIRLVKNWAKENYIANSSYCLELLCVSCFQKSWVWSFDLAANFQKVMERLQKLELLDVSFEENYRKKDYNDRWRTPYVIDPANPFHNTLPKCVEDRRRLNMYAIDTLKKIPKPPTYCTIL